jgi:threonine dehydrogenase-like Zn-dependent dehydrogenase
MRGVVMYKAGDVRLEEREDPKILEPTDAIIDLFFAGIHTEGGPAPVRRFLPDLIQLIWDRKIDPGKVFDLTLPLDQAAEGYQAMDERRATKVLLTL